MHRAAPVSRWVRCTRDRDHPHDHAARLHGGRWVRWDGP